MNAASAVLKDSAAATEIGSRLALRRPGQTKTALTPPPRPQHAAVEATTHAEPCLERLVGRTLVAVATLLLALYAVMRGGMLGQTPSVIIAHGALSVTVGLAMALLFRETMNVYLAIALALLVAVVEVGVVLDIAQMHTSYRPGASWVGTGIFSLVHWLGTDGLAIAMVVGGTRIEATRALDWRSRRSN
jgi:hypothetical protein